MKCDSLFISGIGAYLPPKVDCLDAIREGWCDEETRTEDGWVSATVAGGTPPCEMAVKAGDIAISRSGLKPPDIDVLFYAWTNEQGPHMWLPQFFVERNLIGRDIPAIGIRQACAGIWTSVELAACYLSAQGLAAAVVAGADNFGFDPQRKMMDPSFRWKYSRGTRTSRVSILGDSGAALVLSRNKGFARINSVACRSVSELEGVYRGGEQLFPPEFRDDRPLRMGERVASYGAQHPTEVPHLYRLLDEARIAVVREVLREAATEPEDIARVVHVHAGNDGYIKRILEPLGIAPERGVLEFGRRVGHLSQCGQVAALEYLVMTDQLGPGDSVLVIANAGGASVSAAVVEVNETPQWQS